MQKLAIFVVIIGALIGWMMPSGKSTPATPEAAAAPQQAALLFEDGPAVPRETRIERSENGHFHVHAMVNGQLVRFLVDTGATHVALTEEDAERVGIAINPGSYRVVGMGAGGPVTGQPIDIARVELDGKRVDRIRGAVIDGLEVSLLGQAYLSQMSEVVMAGDTMILR
jgi:aspartyl protease family protein